MRSKMKTLYNVIKGNHNRKIIKLLYAKEFKIFFLQFCGLRLFIYMGKRLYQYITISITP